MRAIACLVLASAFVNAETPVEVFNRAVAALRTGDYVAAEIGFRHVLNASPRHVGALQNLGLIYSKTDRLDQAVATYRHALDLSPENPNLLLNLALVWMKRDDYTAALPVFRSLLKVRPEVPAARDTGLLHQLAAGYLRQNQTEDARRILAEFLATAPAPVGSFVFCQIDSENGRFEEAASQCRKTLSIDPDFPGAHRELGKALAGRHSPDAVAELTAAIRQSPSDPQAAYYLGTALLDQNRFDEAAQQLQRAAQLDSGFWGTWFYLGKARLKLGQPEQSIPLFQKAAQLNPAASTVFYELGLALKATGRNEESGRAMDRVRELRAQELESDIKVLRKR